MVDAVNVAAQSVAANAVVVFGSTRIRTGCTTRHEQGSGRFTLLRPGVYAVSFSANVGIPTGGTVVPVILNIVQDGEAIAGSRMVYTPATAGIVSNVATTVLVRVFETCCCSSISVRNDSGATITLQDANLTLTREC